MMRMRMRMRVRVLESLKKFDGIISNVVCWSKLKHSSRLITTSSDPLLYQNIDGW